MADDRFSEAIRQIVDYKLYSLGVSIPCVIVNIRDINTQRIDVQPLINYLDPVGNDKEHPVILSVPLIFPSTSSSALTLKVNTGDTVLCIFSQRCIDTFKAGDGSPTRPLDLRKFDKRDAMAIPGLFPFEKAINNPTKRTWAHNTNDTVLVHNIGQPNETEIRFKDDGSLVINSTNQFTLNCSKAIVNAPSEINGNAKVNGNLDVVGNINSTQTITATTDVVGGGKSLVTHIHTAPSGGGPTSPPT
jgi:hypothetical protein